MFNRRCSRRTVFALLACLALPIWANEPPQIALIMKSLNNEFFKNMAAGAKAHQAKHNAEYRLQMSGINNEADMAGQLKLLEQAIAAKPQALVFAPVETKPFIPLLKKAISAGILVINIDNKLDDRLLLEAGLNIPFVGPSNRNGSKLAGDYLAQYLRPGDEVAIIEGFSSATNAQSRTQGFRDAMEQAGIKIVATQSGQWEKQPARLVSSGLLTQYPQLKAFLCGNDNMAMGAIEAIGAAGKQGKVLVVGYDNIPAVKPMLADGRLLATVDQFGDQQAVFGIELALKSLAKRQRQDDLQSMVQTEVKLISK